MTTKDKVFSSSAAREPAEVHLSSVPSRRRDLEALLSKSFSPAQLHELLLRVFGLCLVEILPEHRYVPLPQYYFDVLQKMYQNNYLLNNRSGQRFFAELLRERPGQTEEINRLAEAFGARPEQELIDLMGDDRTFGPSGAGEELRELITATAKQARRVQLNVNIAHGVATASWRLEEREIKDSARLSTDTSELHAAQRKLIEVTKTGCTPPQIAEASSALGTKLSKHIFQPGIHAQLAVTQHEVNGCSGELHLQLEFGGEEDLAQLSWELLREPSMPHRFLCTRPGVMLTRRYPCTVRPYKLADTPKQLLLVLGAQEGAEEANEVKKLWEAKDLEVRLLNTPGGFELYAALKEGPWDVMHLITHGDPELVRLKDPLNASQLATIATGNVRAAVLLSVCNSASAKLSNERGDRDAYDRGSLAWRGIAPALIGAGVPDVLAWTNLAYVDECARMTPRWHAHYLQTGDALKATQMARQAIFTAEEYSFGWLAHFTG